MGVIEVFSKTFDILKGNPKIIWPYLIFTFAIGFLAVFLALGAALAFHVSSAAPANSLSAATVTKLITVLIPLYAVIALIAIIVAPFFYGTYISLADQGYGQKKKVNLGKAFNVAKANYLNMLLTFIAIGIISLVVLGIFAVVFIAPIAVYGLHIATGAWLAIGVLVAIVVVVLLAIYLYQAYPVVALERKGPIEAIKRSVQIAKQNTGNVFFMLLATFLLGLAFSIVDTILVFIIQVPLELAGNLTLGIGIAQTVNFILGGVFSAWIALTPAGFYKEFVKGKGKK